MIDWANIWQQIKDFFIGNGWAILGFFVALIVGFIVVKLLIKLARKLFEKTKLEKIAQKFLMSIIKVVLYLVYFIMLLSILGVSITGIIAALSAAVLAIGLALQSSLSNLANGIIIVSSKIFKEGDYISVGGVEGTVKNINLLATTIVTPDNKSITIPNSTIVGGPMTNFNANRTRRIDLNFDLAYETDVEKAKQVIMSVIKSDGRIYMEPAPTIKLNVLSSSSIQLVVRSWVDGEDYWDVYFYLMENIFNELKRNNISIPYNQLEVRMRQDNVVMPFNKDPLPERVEKERKVEEKKHLFETHKPDKAEKKHSKKAEKQLKKSAEKERKAAEKANKQNAKKAKGEKK